MLPHVRPGLTLGILRQFDPFALCEFLPATGEDGAISLGKVALRGKRAFLAPTPNSAPTTEVITQVLLAVAAGYLHDRQSVCQCAQAADITLKPVLGKFLKQLSSLLANGVADRGEESIRQGLSHFRRGRDGITDQCFA